LNAISCTYLPIGTVALCLITFMAGVYAEVYYRRAVRHRAEARHGEVYIPRRVAPGGIVLAPRGTRMEIAADGRVLSVQILEHD